MSFAIRRAFPGYLAYGSPYGAASQCAAIDAQIAALQEQKPSMFRTDGSYSAWKKQMSALKDIRKECEKGSPIVDAGAVPNLLPTVDLSTTSSALPMLAGAGVFALAALGGIALILRRQQPRSNPRRRNRRRR